MSDEIESKQVYVSTTGSAGSATGTGTAKDMYGFLLDIHLDYSDSAPNTTDVTIYYLTRGGDILVVSNSKTDALIAPRQKPVDNANAAIVGANAMYPLDGQDIGVIVGGCDALTNAVIVTLRYLKV